MKTRYKHDEYGDHASERYQALTPYYFTAVALFLIIALKLYAYAVSGAASMLGSLVDSVGDVVLSCFAFLSIRVALKPADHEHRFGHGKAEGFSALVQACFLCGAAVFLCFEAFFRLFEPSVVDNHTLGIGVSVVCIFLTVFIVFVQKRAYAKAPSLALKADQFHYKGDVLLNVAVIVAFVVDLYGGFAYADPLISFGIALYILRTAKHIGKDAVDMLMDREIDQEDRQKIIDIVTGHEAVHGMHDLRTRNSGMHVYISFDVELEGDLTLEDAHAITRDLDLALLKEFPHAEIIIHKDPVGDTYDPRHRVAGVHH